MKVIMIIPAYNEEKNIVRVVNSIKKYAEKISDTNFKLDYIVINDGSIDNTMEICTANQIRVINLLSNLGIGGAVQTGYIYAEQNAYDVAIQFDGDGQHDINSINALLNEIKKGADFVVGSRFLEKTSGFQSTFMRRIGIKWLSCLIKVFSKCDIKDPTSGYRAANKQTIKYLAHNYPTDYPEPEAIVHLAKRKKKIAEVTVNMHEREEGVSSISSWKTVYYMIKVSLAIIIASFQKEGI